MQPEVITFVGGGGKTTAMWARARQARSEGKRVLVTTTTAIFMPSPFFYDDLVLCESESCLLSFATTPSARGHLTLLGRKIQQFKLHGIACEWVDQLCAQALFDLILVEADGSRGRPIKAPAAHEPQIPSRTTELIGVIGFDSYQQPLDGHLVHRPELLAPLVERSLGDAIDEAVWTRLIQAPEGLFKGAPSGAKRVLRLNKVRPDQYELAHSYATLLLQQTPQLHSFQIGLWAPSQVKSAPKISAIILAAGLARRFGQEKLLMPIQNRPMIQKIMELVCQMNFDQTILVYQNQSVRALASAAIECVLNPQAERGQGSSIRCALAKANLHADAFFFFLGDLPLVTPEILATLLQAFTLGQGSIIVPRYAGQRGNPVLFAARWKEALLSVEGDIGGRAICQANPEHTFFVDFPSPLGSYDVDTWDDYIRIEELSKNGDDQ